MRLAEEGEAMSSTNLLTEHLVAPLLPPPPTLSLCPPPSPGGACACVCLAHSVKGASAADVQSYLSDQYDIHTDLHMVLDPGPHLSLCVCVCVCVCVYAGQAYRVCHSGVEMQ